MINKIDGMLLLLLIIALNESLAALNPGRHNKKRSRNVPSLSKKASSGLSRSRMNEIDEIRLSLMGATKEELFQIENLSDTNLSKFINSLSDQSLHSKSEMHQQSDDFFKSKKGESSSPSLSDLIQHFDDDRPSRDKRHRKHFKYTHHNHHKEDEDGDDDDNINIKDDYHHESEEMSTHHHRHHQDSTRKESPLILRSRVLKGNKKRREKSDERQSLLHDDIEMSTQSQSPQSPSELTLLSGKKMKSLEHKERKQQKNKREKKEKKKKEKKERKKSKKSKKNTKDDNSDTFSSQRRDPKIKSKELEPKSSLKKVSSFSSLYPSLSLSDPSKQQEESDGSNDKGSGSGSGSSPDEAMSIEYPPMVMKSIVLYKKNPSMISDQDGSEAGTMADYTTDTRLKSVLKPSPNFRDRHLKPGTTVETRKKVTFKDDPIIMNPDSDHDG